MNHHVLDELFLEALTQLANDPQVTPTLSCIFFRMCSLNTEFKESSSTTCILESYQRLKKAKRVSAKYMPRIQNDVISLVEVK